MPAGSASNARAAAALSPATSTMSMDGAPRANEINCSAVMQTSLRAAPYVHGSTAADVHHPGAAVVVRGDQPDVMIMWRRSGRAHPLAVIRERRRRVAAIGPSAARGAVVGSAATVGARRVGIALLPSRAWRSAARSWAAR